MSPAIKQGFCTKVVKFAVIVCVLLAVIFALVKGNFLTRAVVLFVIISAFYTEYGAAGTLKRTNMMK